MDETWFAYVQITETPKYPYQNHVNPKDYRYKRIPHTESDCLLIGGGGVNSITCKSCGETFIITMMIVVTQE